MTPKDILADDFAALGLPGAASTWLLDLWTVIQAFDDVVDGEMESGPGFCGVIYTALVALPANPFFEANRGALLPALATAFLKWRASDVAERAGDRDATSFVWRASYYDIVLLAVLLCHGVETAQTLAPQVMSIYGEDLKTYLEGAQDA